MSQHPVATVNDSADLSGLARDAVRDFLSSVPEEQLKALLVQWGSSAPFGEFEVGVEERTQLSTLRVVGLWDSAGPLAHRWPYRARVRQEHGEWRLQDILAQCASCFGSGYLDDERRPCDTCDGGGWGVGLGRDDPTPTYVVSA